MENKVRKGIQAENLLKSKEWEFIEEYIKKTIVALNYSNGVGTKPMIEEGIVIKTANEVYRENVGKITALKDIIRDLRRMVEVKNRLVKKSIKDE